MSKHTNNNAPAVVTAPITPATPAYNAQAVRAARVDAVQAALYTRRAAAKLAMHIQATKVANQKAYLAAVAALATQFGVDHTERLVNGNATNIVTKAAPSANSGAVHRVRAIAAQFNFDRKAALAQCAVEGINPHTAATQYAYAKKMHLQVAV